MHGVRRRFVAGDALLLGTDLVKPERELLLAYDDPLGVTAAFNRNLLVRINRELGGDFDLAAFAHQAVWNAGESRIEMHLVAQSRQQIHIEAAQVAFTMEPGERIWTESSYKYHPDDIRRLAEPAGFRVAAQWIDARGWVRADAPRGGLKLKLPFDGHPPRPIRPGRIPPRRPAR